MNALTPIPKEADALHDLQWWIRERERQGTDWKSLLLTVMRTAGVIRPCEICEREPCPTPSFCQLAREADANRASPKAVRPCHTPATTIEAIKWSVRDRGIAALKDSASRERLARCDDAARAEIDKWLTDLKARPR